MKKRPLFSFGFLATIGLCCALLFISTVTIAGIDADGDGIPNSDDNCSLISNPGQEDADSDDIGDTCDEVNDIDVDDDGVNNSLDNCAQVAQIVWDQLDADGDNLGDDCDPMLDNYDYESDGVFNDEDNCPFDMNPDQTDADSDGLGQVCDLDDDVSDTDPDGDGVLNVNDNCPSHDNADQTDTDGDFIGDDCDSVNDLDYDGDGILNNIDNCRLAANAPQTDTDSDGLGDACDATDSRDADSDGILNAVDNCSLVSNAGQADADSDGLGDACDEVEDSGFSGDGSGTEEDPYLVDSCIELQEMSLDLDAYYELSGDVDCGLTSLWNDGEGFEPIGTFGAEFTGSFDGNNYTINELHINRPGSDFQGVFGYASGASISNVDVGDATIIGKDSSGGLVGYLLNSTVFNSSANGEIDGEESVGGLVGHLSGGMSLISYSSAIMNVYGAESAVGGLLGTLAGTSSGDFYVIKSFSAGSVESSAGNVGGLVGYISTGGISDSYSQSDVTQTTGGNQIGGLVGGASFATINRTYASGTITVTGDTSIGGLVGGAFFTTSITNSFSTATGGTADVHGLYGSYSLGDPETDFTFSNNYYDVSNSGSGFCSNNGTQDEAGCTGVDPEDDFTYWKDAANEPIIGWDTEDVWNLFSMSNYPWLLEYEEEFVFSGAGTGVEGDPYIITSCEQLMEINNVLDGFWEIDAAAEDVVDGELDCTLAGNDIMIGTDEDPFLGHFVGNNVIVVIDIDSELSYLGLFRHIAGANISELGVAGNIDTTDGSYVGGMVGFADDSELESLFSSVVVIATEASEYVGGFAGYIDGGLAEDSYATGDVVGGDENTGGFVGEVDGEAIISHCYATGDVSISDVEGIDIGGFAGDIDDSIVSYSYATGDVTGVSYVGGFVGDSDTSAEITKSYSTGTVTGTGENIGGFIGDAQDTVLIQNSYTLSDVVGNDDTGGFIGDMADTTIINSYSAGSVTSEGVDVGGFVGEDEAGNTFTALFFDADVAGIDNACGDTDCEGISGLTTELMKTELTFTDAGWDFDEVWAIDGLRNSGYSYLQNTNIEDAAVPYVITEVTPIPSTTTDISPVYHFAIEGEGEAELVVGDGCGNDVLAEAIGADPDDQEVQFSNLEVGETYECVVFVNSDAGTSNELTVGPFTIVAGGGSTTGTSLLARARHLRSHGKVEQAKKIEQKFSLPSSTTISLSLNRLLKFGMTGEDVRTMQKLLNEKGYILALTGPGSPGFETPYYGPKTLAMIKKFQLANGLIPDGIVGPLTWKALTQ